jgi:hypothetical protein
MSYVPNTYGVPTISVLMLALLYFPYRLCCLEDVEGDVEFFGDEFF